MDGLAVPAPSSSGGMRFGDSALNRFGHGVHAGRAIKEALFVLNQGAPDLRIARDPPQFLIAAWLQEHEFGQTIISVLDGAAIAEACAGRNVVAPIGLEQMAEILLAKKRVASLVVGSELLEREARLS